MKNGCLPSLGILGAVFICLWVVCAIWHGRYAREFLDPNQEWRFLGEWKAYKLRAKPKRYERFGSVGATFRADGTCTLLGVNEGAYTNRHFNTNEIEGTWSIYIDTNRWERRLVVEYSDDDGLNTWWEKDLDDDIYIGWFSDGDGMSFLLKESLNVPAEEKKHFP